jgi:hypothetical protein
MCKVRRAAPWQVALGKGNVEDLTGALSLSQSRAASEERARLQQGVFRRSLAGFSPHDSSSYGFSSHLERPGLLIGCLVVIAGLPRVIAALTLINPDPDAYEYIEAVARVRAHLTGGGFSVKDLAGFWLPMYQFICACISILFNHPVYVTKLFSALCGTASCLVVYLLSVRLIGRRFLALATFVLVALNPLHIMYSAYSMTEAPFAFLVLTSLYLATNERWTASAVAATAAGFIRVDAWILIPIIPALEYAVRRRISVTACFTLAAGPAICLYIYWAATGDPFQYFHARTAYVRDTIAAQSELAQFSVLRIATDARRFFYSANPAIVVACFAAVYIAISCWQARRPKSASPDLFPVASSCAFFFSFLAFIILAYVTNSQPQIWVRYGLIFMVLGAPISAWTISKLSTGHKRKANVIGAAACVALFSVQLADAVAYARATPPQLSIIQRIRIELEEDPGGLIFCDDPETRVMSNLPPDTFITSSDLLPDQALSLAEVKESHVRLIVLANRTAPAGSGLLAEVRQGAGALWLQQIMHEGPDRGGTELWLFRVN